VQTPPHQSEIGLEGGEITDVIDFEAPGVAAEEQEPEEEKPVVPGTIVGGELEVSSQSDCVTIECLGKNAGYRHELYLDNTDTFICNSADRGTIVNLGQFPAGTELIFRLDVKNTGKSYYTGGAERHPNHEIHARADTFEDGSQEFGFDDLYGGGDRDYDDCMFSLTGTRSQSEENAQE